MNCITKVNNAQIEVKKSKFISFLLPFSEFESFHQKLKKEHPKANHIVFAYRYLNEYKQIVERSSDDGEPKGAAGVPTLKALRGSNLINAAILTVRYFGGIKLGVGGMARAYSDAANAVIKEAKIEPYIELIQKEFEIDYNKQREFEYKLQKLNINNVKREFNEKGVLYKIFIDKDIEI